MPITRQEKLLNTLATGVASGVSPITREEQYLAYIAGETYTKPDAPITRKEAFLDKIPQGGGGGGGGVTIRNQNKTITENGTYTADSGYTGLGTVTVDVQASGSAVLKELVATKNKEYLPNSIGVGDTLTFKENFSISDFPADLSTGNSKLVSYVSDGTDFVIICTTNFCVYTSNVAFFDSALGISIQGVVAGQWLSVDVATLTATITSPPSVVATEEELDLLVEVGTYFFESFLADGYSKVVVDVKPALEELTVIENGEFTPTEPAVGFSKVIATAPIAKQLGDVWYYKSADGNDVSIFGEGIMPSSSYKIFGADVKSAHIMSGITSTNLLSFNRCTSLKTVTLPDTLLKIDQYAFKGCSNLKKINIPASLNNLEVEAFSGCNSLEGTLVFPESFKGSISQYAFSGCWSLTGITFLGDVSHNGTSFIGDYAFAHCKSLEFIDFSNCLGIPNLYSSVFVNVPSTCKVILPDNLYQSWRSKTNWVNWVDKITFVKKSEVTE